MLVIIRLHLIALLHIPLLSLVLRSFSFVRLIKIWAYHLHILIISCWIYKEDVLIEATIHKSIGRQKSDSSKIILDCRISHQYLASPVLAIGNIYLDFILWLVGPISADIISTKSMRFLKLSTNLALLIRKHMKISW